MKSRKVSQNKEKYREQRKESDGNKFQLFSHQNYGNSSDYDSNL